MKYCNGIRFNLFIEKGIITRLDGEFYERGDTWGPTYINLMNDIKEIDCVRIQNPNISELYPYTCQLYVEYFNSIVVVDKTLIIEI